MGGMSSGFPWKKTEDIRNNPLQVVTGGVT